MSSLSSRCSSSSNRRRLPLFPSDPSELFPIRKIKERVSACDLCPVKVMKRKSELCTTCPGKNLSYALERTTFPSVSYTVNYSVKTAGLLFSASELDPFRESLVELSSILPMEQKSTEEHRTSSPSLPLPLPQADEQKPEGPEMKSRKPEDKNLGFLRGMWFSVQTSVSSLMPLRLFEAAYLRVAKYFGYDPNDHEARLMEALQGVGRDSPVGLVQTYLEMTDRRKDALKIVQIASLLALCCVILSFCTGGIAAAVFAVGAVVLGIGSIGFRFLKMFSDPGSQTHLLARFGEKVQKALHKFDPKNPIKEEDLKILRAYIGFEATIALSFLARDAWAQKHPCFWNTRHRMSLKFLETFIQEHLKQNSSDLFTYSEGMCRVKEGKETEACAQVCAWSKAMQKLIPARFMAKVVRKLHQATVGLGMLHGAPASCYTALKSLRWVIGGLGGILRTVSPFLKPLLCPFVPVELFLSLVEFSKHSINKGRLAAQREELLEKVRSLFAQQEQQRDKSILPLSLRKSVSQKEQIFDDPVFSDVLRPLVKAS